MDRENNHALDRNLKIGLVLNTTFTVFEFAAGLLTGSLALISDSAHNLTDSLALVISLLSNRISQKGANAKNSYGYGRVSILGALINAFILLGVAIYIFYEAYKRIQNPPVVQGGYIAIVAVIGVAVNAFIASLYFKNKQDLNAKSIFLNMATDALAQLGTVIAGILIILTGLHIIDPLISILIGVLLLYSGWNVIKDALQVLLEGVPEGVNMQAIKETMLKTPLVKNVDDLHIWAISSQYAALSCHLVIEECDLDKSMKIVEQIKKELREKFHIEHATIETELIECPPDSK